MKTLNKLFAIGALAFLLMLMAPTKSMAQDDGYVSDQEFYDELQQYGTWVQDDHYGDVWVPDVDGDFRPYATNGYWVQTDYGTTWVSDYPWGWATFHYGRWRYDDYYGWEWIPGHEWAPAWVSWRQGGGYYGWAPMGPGVSVTLSLGGVGLSIASNYWTYAPQRYITSRYINRYYAPQAQLSIIIRNTTYIHNTYVYNKRTYITGPRPADIQKITRRRVTVYKINNANKPGSVQVEKGAINIYRPAIRKSPDARPVRVVSATAYRNEHPTEGIGKKGVTGYNHGNAAKLASTARSNTPDNKVIKVNPVHNRKPEPNEPNKPNEPATHPQPVVPAEGNKPIEHNNNNTPAQPTETRGGKGHHKQAPAVTQPEQPQPAVNTPAEPQGNAQLARPVPTAGGKGHNHKPAPAVIPPAQHNADQAQQQQAQQAHQQDQQEKQQQAQQARQQAQQEKQQQAQQARQQAQQEKQQQAQQARQQEQQQAQQEKQQQAQQARQQAQQEKQQQAQQARQQEQQQAQQARQQAQQEKQQQVQQVRQQQQQQARQQAQQEKQQQAQQARQQQQQAKQQAQEAARQQAEQKKQDAQKTPPN